MAQKRSVHGPLTVHSRSIYGPTTVYSPFFYPYLGSFLAFLYEKNKFICIYAKFVVNLHGF